MTKLKENNHLSRKEKASSIAYKMMSQNIERLEKSLKKTQDAHELERQEKHTLEIKIALLQSRLENSLVIEIFKFISSGGVGFGINYISSGSWEVGLLIGIPSVIIYMICILLSKK